MYICTSFVFRCTEIEWRDDACAYENCEFFVNRRNITAHTFSAANTFIENRNEIERRPRWTRFNPYLFAIGIQADTHTSHTCRHNEKRVNFIRTETELCVPMDDALFPFHLANEWRFSTGLAFVFVSFCRDLPTCLPKGVFLKMFRYTKHVSIPIHMVMIVCTNCSVISSFVWIKLAMCFDSITFLAA